MDSIFVDLVRGRGELGGLGWDEHDHDSHGHSLQELVGGCYVASWDQKTDCYVIGFVDLVQGVVTDGRDRDFGVEPGEVMAVEILLRCVSFPLPLALNMR